MADESITGVAQQVVMDTVINAMQACDQKIVRQRSGQEYINLNVSDIQKIEYKDYSNFDAGLYSTYITPGCRYCHYSNDD